MKKGVGGRGLVEEGSELDLDLRAGGHADDAVHRLAVLEEHASGESVDVVPGSNCVGEQGLQTAEMANEVGSC